MGKKNLYIIIIGCGKLGAFLANEFSKIGDSVVVIDKNGRKFSKLSVDFSGFRIEEDALDEDILIEAKIDQADVLICASNDDDTKDLLFVMRELGALPDYFLKKIRAINTDPKAVQKEYTELVAQLSYNYLNRMIKTAQAVNQGNESLILSEELSSGD